MYKIKRTQIYLVLFLALLFQLTIIDAFRILGAKPDLMLIAVIFFGFFLGEGAGLEAGLVAGFLKDIFAFDFFGVNTLILGITGFLVGVASTKLFKESGVTQFFVVIFSSIFSMSLHFICDNFVSGHLYITYSEYFFVSVLPASFYTGIVSIPIFVKFVDIFNLRLSEEFI